MNSNRVCMLSRICILVFLAGLTGCGGITPDNLYGSKGRVEALSQAEEDSKVALAIAESEILYIVEETSQSHQDTNTIIDMRIQDEDIQLSYNLGIEIMIDQIDPDAYLAHADNNTDNVEYDPFSEFPDDAESAEAIEILRKTLMNEARFMYNYDEYVLLSECYFSTEETVMDFSLEYAVVDMDSDGIPEVILNISNFMKFVFHYDDGIVFSHIFGIKCMNGVKKDGSFGWGYAAYNGWSTIEFSRGEYIITEYAICNKNKNPILYTVYREQVTKEEYEAFRVLQDEKEDVVWFGL